MSARNVTFYDSARPRRPVVGEILNLWSYRGLIKLLVTRDLTVRYKRSVLGAWWTLLNPLLTSLVMWVVFSQLFERFATTGVSYAVYLISGVVLSQTFAQSLIASGSAIINSRSILSKVYVPAEVFSFSAAIAGVANLFFGVIALVVVQLATGTGVPWTIVLVPIPAVALLGFVTGLGLMVAAAAVYFYDVLDLSRVAVQLATYATPVFYPLSIVPDRFLPFIEGNPLTAFLDVFRGFMYEGRFADGFDFILMGASSVVALALGVWVFARSWRNIAVML
jgi:ABC-type polysaccharide/polyol phosphate export permease